MTRVGVREFIFYMAFPADRFIQLMAESSKSIKKRQIPLVSADISNALLAKASHITKPSLQELEKYSW